MDKCLVTSKVTTKITKTIIRTSHTYYYLVTMSTRRTFASYIATDDENYNHVGMDGGKFFFQSTLPIAAEIMGGNRTIGLVPRYTKKCTLFFDIDEFEEDKEVEDLVQMCKEALQVIFVWDPTNTIHVEVRCGNACKPSAPYS
eukprot:300018_1